MEFGDLPLELRLKIFSYLPHHSLLTIADVSREWKDLAFDPLLWTKIKIDWSLDMTLIFEILQRATLLRSLHISRNASFYLDEFAPALPRIQTLGELIIHYHALSPSLQEALKNCPSVSSVVLVGGPTLVEREVAVLTAPPNLKSLVLSQGVRVPDQALHQISFACPGLERLEFNSDRTSCWAALTALSRLQKLTSLSMTIMCKDALPFVSVSCPQLEDLHIGALKNAKGETETSKLEFFRLMPPSVNNWFNATSPVLTSLKCFDVPQMSFENRELQCLLRNGGQSLQHVEFNALRLSGSVLDVLSVCRGLESLHLYGLSGDNLCLAALRKFPKLVRASLNGDKSAVGALQQLPLMVDISPATSPLRKAFLVLDVYCSSKTSRNAAMPAVSAFKDFIVSNTRVSEERIQDAVQLGQGSRKWARRTVTTWFPPAIETLKWLELNLGRH